MTPSWQHSSISRDHTQTELGNDRRVPFLRVSMEVHHFQLVLYQVSLLRHRYHQTGCR